MIQMVDASAGTSATDGSDGSDRVATPAERLRAMVNGYQLSQALHVAVTLRVPDLLAGGERSADELASVTGAHPPSLYRLLRALAAAGVLDEGAGRRFGLTDLGDLLRSDHPSPLAGWTAFIGQPYYWQAWGHLLHSVRTGGTGFEHVHGMEVWEYRAAHPELSATFDGAMTSLSRQVADAVVGAYDFSRFASVTDVGGGRGAFLAAVLQANPTVRGVLFDQPHVVAGVADELAAAGLGDRCTVVGGSFFDSVPAGSDAYVLKSVIHDWDDERSIAILRACRAALAPAGRVLVVERDLGGPNDGLSAKLSDLNMLVSPGGMERTTDEYATLFRGAGLRLVDTCPTDVGTSVYEGEPEP
jgi:hypothetical protein